MHFCCLQRIRLVPADAINFFPMLLLAVAAFVVVGVEYRSSLLLRSSHHRLLLCMYTHINLCMCAFMYSVRLAMYLFLMESCFLVAKRCACGEKGNKKSK